MCGVAALFAYKSTAGIIDVRELCRIRDAMKRRGPDGVGEWISADGRVGLGHRRLSILDLSERGSQPMASPDGKIVISFNGEIYNFQELRRRLQRAGHVFETASDTEVLLKLYAEKGTAMLSELRGMFAFVLWDAREKSLLLARDPYGVKPLYYSDDGGTLRVGSQVKALVAGGRVSASRDIASAAGFFLTGSVPEPRTFCAAVRSVPAGCWIRVDAEGVAPPTSFFSIAEMWSGQRDKLPSAEAPARIRETLADSVRYHHVSDVPVAIFLSAGIDSGVLAALASENVESRPRTLTLGFDDSADESALAARVAECYGSVHACVRLSSADFDEEFQRFISVMDQPTVDGLNVYFISLAAARAGYKVALSGIGADELFGGYPSFRDVPRWKKAFAWSSGRAVGRKLRQIVNPVSRVVSPKAAGLFEYGGTYAGAYFAKRALFMPWELSALMPRDEAEEGLRQLDYLAQLEKAVPQDGAFSAVSSLESQFYLRNQLLRDADWAGMAHSVEIRVPYVDVPLLRRVTASPRENMPAKSWLARVPKTPLPKEILSRKKTGFTIPSQLWTRSSQKMDEWKEVPLLRERCHWSRRWAYSVYRRWRAES